MKLYEISSEIRRILDQAVDPDTGELMPETEQQLNALQMEFSKKVEAICCVIRERTCHAAAVKIEIDRLTAVRRADDNAVERLKSYVLHEMRTLGTVAVETDLFKVREQKSPPSALATMPAELLDPEYTRVKCEPDNMAAIKHWRETGETPTGFEIRQGTHLRIS